MSKGEFTVKIDGREISARPGQMLIELMDEHDIAVPRFCYHPRLTIAANCRMCMVEVEKAPKPLPACATPVAPNMVVRSRSKLALESQKGTMEMLLINHPLDCPVCDQGGECELQDVSLEHGQSYSRYGEPKRAVEDESLGSLISTDMTRCIHCTRCVRFGTEIAGQAELGATGRGEDMRIGTYVAHAVSSELSGNMIDVCPVGALNSKPYRMRARAWEMERQPGIACHDCLGSNTYVHTLRSQVMRVLPRECEDINQSWLSDRDRFAYCALESEGRQLRPQIHDSVRSRHSDTDWYTVITASCEALQKAVRFKDTEIGVLVGANSSLEEMHLLARLAQSLGVGNIDHRLAQLDFGFDEQMPAAPWLGRGIEEIERDDAVLLIGADVRKQQPMLGARLRQAALGGMSVSLANLYAEDVHFPVDKIFVGDPDKVFSDLLCVLRHLAKLGKRGSDVYKRVSEWTRQFIIKPGKDHQALAERLAEGDATSVIVGAGAFGWPNFSGIRALSQALAEMSGSAFGFLPHGANAVGAWYAGCVPHRASLDGKGGDVAEKGIGKNAAQMLREPLDTYILFNCDPVRDSQLGALAREALGQASAVIDINSFAGSQVYSGTRLPLATYFEAPGTYVNACGQWQYQEASAPPSGQSLPGWKILSMLARACGFEDLDYASCDDLSDEIVHCYGDVSVNTLGGDKAEPQKIVPVPLRRLSRPSCYQGDALLRHAEPLQQTVDAACDRFLWMNPKDAAQRGIEHGDHALVRQDGNSITLRVLCSDSVCEGTVLTAQGSDSDIALGEPFSAVEIERASEQATASGDSGK